MRRTINKGGNCDYRSNQLYRNCNNSLWNWNDSFNYNCWVDIHRLSSKKHLKGNNKNPKFERELGVFRERLINIRNLTSTFIDQSISYTKLAITLQAKHIDNSYSIQLLTDLSVKEHDLEKILYDPSFRSITNMLPPNNSEKLFGEFEKTTRMMSAFHEDAVGKLKSNTQQAEFINILANKAIDISKNLNTIANMFAIEFANLERDLANISDKK